uniref:ARAD1C07546p n=1 Tax=Blastobotrys adeninivorans TaxID=409370 RepID=A0A060T504_BLAAD
MDSPERPSRPKDRNLDDFSPSLRPGLPTRAISPSVHINADRDEHSTLTVHSRDAMKSLLDQFDPLTLEKSNSSNNESDKQLGSGFQPGTEGSRSGQKEPEEPKEPKDETGKQAEESSSTFETEASKLASEPLPNSKLEPVPEPAPEPVSDPSLQPSASKSASVSKSEPVSAREVAPGAESSVEEENGEIENEKTSRENKQTKSEEQEEQDKPFDFQRFLGQLRHRSADPIARYLKSFLMEFNKRYWTTNEQVKIISDFKVFIAAKMAVCPPFSNLSEHEMENALEGMEKLIMNRLYSRTFSPEIPANRRADDHEEDVIRDRVLSEKLRIWRWVEGRHLDIKESFLRNGESFVHLASDELNKINHFRAPRDKVICVLNCCKVIFGLLRQTKSEESADMFLPILIYVLLKSQPNDIISNINYIQRFRNPDRLNGEVGYYLSSLVGAVSFIEALDKSSLSISDEEFERKVDESVKDISNEIPEITVASSGEASSQQQQKQNQGVPPATPEASKDSSPNPTSTASTRPSTPSGGLNASTVIMNSAGLLTSPLKSLSSLFAQDSDNNQENQNDTKKTNNPQANEDKISPQESAARQISAEEAEARRIYQQEFESVSDTLSQMFPVLDREVIQDILREKQGRIGAAVDACLALVDST